jgi:hypothetical protein
MINGDPYSNPIAASQTRLIDRRHREWRLHHIRWTWLLDSLEGGEQYRNMVYGWDSQLQPIRNLIRHPHEYPDPRQRRLYGPMGRPDGTDQYAQATDDPYELRRARTPVPKWIRRTLDKHLSKIFGEDAQREGPPEVEAWWEDVDGGGSTIRNWMKDTVCPLGFTLGQLDIICDHPPLPDDVKPEDIRTNADARQYDLNRVVASYLLPENVIDWKLDRQGRYVEILLMEPQESGEIHYRHWTPEDWTCYDGRGNVIEGPVAHPYGRPPIERLFDQRRPRCRNVGMPRYEEIAELQREFYNADSESILANCHQTHSVVQAPEDYCQAGETIPLGPNNILPMKKVGEGSVNEKYQPWEVLEFPQAGSDSIRQDKQDLLNRADLAGHLLKPAGAVDSTGSNVVAQSGISKQLDQQDGNEVLGDIAEVVARWDKQIAELMAFVQFDGQIPAGYLDQIEIRYPRDFDLTSPENQAGQIGDFQQSLQGTGATPTADQQMMSSLYRKIVKGPPDDHFEAVDKEIGDAIAANGKRISMQREAEKAQLIGENAPGVADEGSGSDQGGSSAGFGLQITSPAG